MHLGLGQKWRDYKRNSAGYIVMGGGVTVHHRCYYPWVVGREREDKEGVRRRTRRISGVNKDVFCGYVLLLFKLHNGRSNIIMHEMSSTLSIDDMFSYF